MKKLLGILVLGLLWCNFASAEILLNACGNKRKDGSFRKIGENQRHEYFISFKDGKIYKTKVSSQLSADAQNSMLKDVGSKDFKDRVKNQIFTITFADEKMITGKLIEIEQMEGGEFSGENYSTTFELFINLDNNIVEISRKGNDALGILVTGWIHEYYEKTFDRKNLIYKCYREDLSDSSDETGHSSGTAFFINNRGNLLTNNHVVEGCKSQKINYFNKEHEVKIIATDKTLDLALLKANVKPKSYISFSKNEPKKRQTITAAGYPLGQFLSDDLKINDGRISALKGFDNNSNEIQHDIAINPGNSGGPIVNEKGQLVAIAVSGMAKDITEGLNFGIKSSAAANFLKSNKISPSASYMNFSTSDDKLVKLLEESTVYTFCE
jgi:S1-C subfamily serine protease